MKVKYLYITFILLIAPNILAQTTVVIPNGTGIYIPLGSTFCADTIKVLEGGYYITEDSSGTCSGATIIGVNNYTQVEFTPHTITTNAILVSSVYAIDLDSDEDIDVLSDSGDKIVWYENDGNENFTTYTLATNLHSPQSIYATDIDGDWDVDFLFFYVSNYPYKKVVWCENDGNENFTQHTITAIAASSLKVYAVDLDGDGDIDVLSTSYNVIAWYENDGNENFTQHTITIDAAGAVALYAVDLDGDEDIDVLSACRDKIDWYENDGNENFTQRTITIDVLTARSVYAIDMDSDGDIDVLSASENDNKIAWYENDGNENFTQYTITTGAIGARAVYAVDLDGDGDMDVLSESGEDDKIAWYANDGNENFVQYTIVIYVASHLSVPVIDIDSDGDIDVLSSSFLDNKIVWYENLSPIIPVELTSFTASTSNGKVTLNWSTATETNNSGFEILRQAQDDRWSLLGFVEGHGTTAEIQNYQYIDNISDIQATSLSYRLKQIDYDGSYEYSKVVEIANLAPTDFALHQNFPNPFNPVTTISYSLPVKSYVELVVYNTLGESIVQLVNEEKEAGRYEAKFSADALPSGIYFYRLQVYAPGRAGSPSAGSGQSFVETKKMVLLR